MMEDSSKILDEISLYIDRKTDYEFNNIAKLIISLENTNYKTNDKFLKSAYDIDYLITYISRKMANDIKNTCWNYCIEESKKGNSFADYILACAYWNMDDNDNYTKGFEYMKAAADKNNMFAQYELYDAYKYGESGPKKNSKKAYEYCKLACDQNYGPAVAEMAEEYVLKYIGSDKWASESEYWIKNIEKFIETILKEHEKNDMAAVLRYIIKENRRLETQVAHLQYMPNGPGYENAKSEFQSASRQTNSS